jgi:hypothetical protein
MCRGSAKSTIGARVAGPKIPLPRSHRVRGNLITSRPTPRPPEHGTCLLTGGREPITFPTVSRARPIGGVRAAHSRLCCHRPRRGLAPGRLPFLVYLRGGRVRAVTVWRRYVCRLPGAPRPAFAGEPRNSEPSRPPAPFREGRHRPLRSPRAKGPARAQRRLSEPAPPHRHTLRGRLRVASLRPPYRAKALFGGHQMGLLMLDTVLVSSVSALPRLRILCRPTSRSPASRTRHERCYSAGSSTGLAPFRRASISATFFSTSSTR